jgi:hypothetical protein
VLTDGYRQAGFPKIETIRSDRSMEPVCNPEDLLAVATDFEIDLNIPRFDLDDPGLSSISLQQVTYSCCHHKAALRTNLSQEKQMSNKLPVGKLPIDLLSELLAGAPVSDARVRLGPGIGLDCAVIDMGSNLLVMKSDPITFATEDVGWYLVQINANDIATTGAKPRWMMVTLLLPEGCNLG